MKGLEARRLAGHLDRLAGTPVLVIGDVILDHYVTGQVSRISPEAPVPVVGVDKEFHRLGGAGNVARNIAAMGGRPHLLGIAGQDEPAEVLTELLREQKLSFDLVSLPGRRTTLKTRIIAHSQQMLRVDRETPAPLSQDENARLCEKLDALVGDYQAIILSDYAKGLVTGLFMETLRGLLARKNPRPRLIIDPRIRNFAFYDQAYLVTPNTKEAAEGAGLPLPENEADLLRISRNIFDKIHCENLLVTMGPQGMALFEAPERGWRIPTTARQVFDVTGAGDTVAALAGLALAAGLTLPEAAVLANYAAGLVVGQIGTASTNPAELACALGELDFPDIRPIGEH